MVQNIFGQGQQETGAMHPVKNSQILQWISTFCSNLMNLSSKVYQYKVQKPVT